MSAKPVSVKETAERRTEKVKLTTQTVIGGSTEQRALNALIRNAIIKALEDNIKLSDVDIVGCLEYIKVGFIMNQSLKVLEQGD
jgi:hypothetical protein